MKLSKILSIVVIAIMLLAVAGNFIYAADVLDPSTISVDTSGDGPTKVREIGGKVIGIVQVAGSVIAAVIIVVIGIKYMMGSAEEKAEYKKTMIPYLIGAVLIFAGTSIAGMVYNMAKGIA